ncbi:MAG: phosphoglycerate kinase [Desulfobacteraceae bacterium]|nr:phosphoglycerate kinase [Desulfobacteraceae bacterium]MCF8094367.1 phosphoglycerate kinase [Desulfobacteraceae bacterium]
MKLIKELNLAGKKVLVRVDFNVPMDEHQNITDDTRIREVLPTLRYILDNKGKLIIMSHMGRPKGKRVDELSLAPVAKRLARLLEQEVDMAQDCIGEEVERRVDSMGENEILLLENLRFHKGEEENDPEFAKKLAALGDVYINDAFAVSHRAHASVEGIVNYFHEAAAGFLLLKELKYFKDAMENPRRPLVAIVGGAKVSGKFGALENLLPRVNKLIIGGAMANTFLKGLGFDLGNSKVEDDLVGAADELRQRAIREGIKFYLPVDAVVAPEPDPKAETKIVPIQEIPENWMALDIGPATSRLFDEVLYNAKTIIWNGPMGMFEIDSFSRGTISMVYSVADSYALSIVGGGDTDVAIHSTGQTDRISYISTGGGAFLQLLEGKPLPGIVALGGSDIGG